MNLEGFDFGCVDWDNVESVEHPGETGTAYWRTIEVGAIRVRRVDYSPGYRADHWCKRGHIVLVLDGELVTELADGRRVVLHSRMSYHVADGRSPHRSSTSTGATIFIVDSREITP
jgi:hypothetical protein